jgi:hypothetical protein
MRQDNHILALALAWRLAVIGTLPSWADIHDLAQPFDGQNVRVPCDEANRICFAPQRTGWPFLYLPRLSEQTILFPQLRDLTFEIGLDGWFLRIAPILLDPAAQR